MANALMVRGKPMRSMRAPDATSPRGSPYTASARTPMTRPRNRSPLMARRVAVIEIMPTFWTKPAVKRVRSPASRLLSCPKAMRSTYQMTVYTSMERPGRRDPPVITTVIDARRPPSEKLATSQPSPVASAR